MRMQERMQGEDQGEDAGEDAGRGCAGDPASSALERGEQRALGGSGRQEGTCSALEESATSSASCRSGGTVKGKEGDAGKKKKKMMQLLQWIRQSGKVEEARI